MLTAALEGVILQCFLGTRYEANWTSVPNPKIGNCNDVLDWPNWTQDYKQGLLDFGAASADVLQNWFFWNWKIGNSSVTGERLRYSGLRSFDHSFDKTVILGKVESPHWSYQLGLQEGWIAKDPRASRGTCAQQGVNVPRAAALSGPQTGGPGAGTFPPDQISSYGQWPPASIIPYPSLSVDPVPAAGLPLYIQTGAPVTLTAAPPQASFASYTATASIDPGSGWANPNDVVGAYVPAAGCDYPDPWDAVNAAAPACAPHLRRRSGGSKGEGVIITADSPPFSTITPPPQVSSTTSALRSPPTQS